MACHGIKLSPTLISMDWGHLAKSIKDVEAVGADFLHFDVADSYFSPEFGMPLGIIESITSQTNLPLDLHLMVEEPRRIYEWLPPSPTRVTIHYEACRNLHRDLVALRQLGHSPGLALNPSTNLDLIEYVIEEIDHALVMTNNPGFLDQPLTPQILSKIERLQVWRDETDRSLEISVDGNISLEDVPSLVEAGAELLTLPQNTLDDSPRLEEMIKEALPPHKTD
jgi:ribulose-phosphate 3-epimerase